MGGRAQIWRPANKYALKCVGRPRIVDKILSALRCAIWRRFLLTRSAIDPALVRNDPVKFAGCVLVYLGR
jgi:hypothetical protein